MTQTKKDCGGCLLSERCTDQESAAPPYSSAEASGRPEPPPRPPMEKMTDSGLGAVGTPVLSALLVILLLLWMGH